jgi:hypothetical protein
MRSQLLAVVLSVLIPACAALDPAYVQAERATFDALAPAHRSYVDADLDLSGDEKARRMRLLDSWEARIERAERELAE